MADAGTKTNYLVEYQIAMAGGDPREFLVQDVAITDALNQCYSVRVRCNIPAAREESGRAACTSRRLKDVELFMRRRFPDGFVLENRIVGVLLSLERATAEESDDSFALTLVPAMALLAHHVEGGTWHNRSYADVMREVLRKGLSTYGRTIEDRITRDYPEIDLIVRRPDETLLAFVQKLAARTGINFYFRHDGNVETLVLCDTNEGFLDGNQRQRRDLPFRPVWLEHATDGEEQILSARRAAQLDSSEVEFLGFDVAGTPMEPVKGLAKQNGGHTAKRQVSDGFRVNEREDPDAQHARVAQLHGEVAGTAENRSEVNTTITGALAGRRYRIELERGDSREFIVMGVSAGGRSFAAPGADYSNSLTLVPTKGDNGETVQIRAPAPPDEKVPAIVRATVVAIENDPVDVDGLLRCRLRFAWDQQQKEVPTTYVSVLQSMAGTHGGTQYIPRAGDRVLVSFIGGNLERPIILGSLYDKQNTPPTMGPPERAQTLPTAASWLGWNHASIGDKSRQSMLCMDVTAGAEMMFFNAPYDWRADIGHDAQTHIVHDERRKVDNDFDETVAGNYTQSVGRDRNEKVSGNHSLSVNGKLQLDVGGRATLSYASGLSTTCRGGSTSVIEGGKSENVMSGDRSTRVTGGSCRYAVGGAFTVVASSVSIGVGGIGGGSGPAAGGALSLGKTALLECLGGAAVSSGPSSVGADADGVSLRGPRAQMRDQAGGSATLAGGSYVVDVPQGVVLRCGTTELRLTPQGLFVNGQQLVLQGARTQIRTGTLDIDPPDGNG